MARPFLAALVGAAGLLGAGCASTSPKDAFKDVAQAVEKLGLGKVVFRRR